MSDGEEVQCIILWLGLKAKCFETKGKEHPFYGKHKSSRKHFQLEYTTLLEPRNSRIKRGSSLIHLIDLYRPEYENHRLIFEMKIRVIDFVSCRLKIQDRDTFSIVLLKDWLCTNSETTTYSLYLFKRRILARFGIEGADLICKFSIQTFTHKFGITVHKIIQALLNTCP